ncbi:MAG: cytochrome c oxidase assembly protein [Pseudomonadota bacterium]
MSEASKDRADSVGDRNRSVAISCVAFVGLMVGAAYAAVPLYDLFCRVTGFGGTTQVADSVPDAPIDRRIKIRFDANVAGGLPWDFDSKNREVTLQVGEAGAMDYVAVNRGATTNWGTSTFNVTPYEAGAYFNKMECFCFTEQKLKQGETIEMPVVFFVDPEIDNDPNLKSIETITLSYTFFPAEAPDQPVAAATENSVDGKEKL